MAFGSTFSNLHFTNLHYEMTGYTQFSEIISNGDDSRFNAIWEELSLPGRGKREEPEVKRTRFAPSPKPTRKKASPKLPATRKKPRRQRPRPNISDITINDEQSVASSISISSVSTFLSDDSIYTSPYERSRSDNICVNPLSIPACVSEKVPSCVNEEAILQKVSDDVVKVTVKGESVKKSAEVEDNFSPSLFSESTNIVDEVAKPKTAEHEKTNTTDKPTVSSEPDSKPSSFKLCLFNREPFYGISELVTCTSRYFTSSPLDPDGDCSARSSICTKKQILNADEKVEKETPRSVCGFASDVRAIRCGDRSLLDMVAIPKPQTPEASENQAKQQDEDAGDEENITEGLGLVLPPVALKRTSRTSNNTKSAATNLETVEESKIEIDSSYESVKVFDSSNRDVYIKYRIGGYHSEYDETLTSDSQISFSSFFSRQSLEKKPVFKKLLKTKLFASKDKKTKTNTKKKNRIAKLRKSILDSPGSATIETAETSQSIISFAGISFGEDHPTNPLKLPFLRRRRQQEPPKAQARIIIETRSSF